MNKYYTKCGREFERSAKAEVTGYHLTEASEEEIRDEECKACPFAVDVTEGWPQKHKWYECRAGSERPNHENEWRGSLEDKNTMQVLSLDHEFCETVIAFAREHPELSAAYNQDCGDCRRRVSISCSQNKKGMAAKSELVDKFFSAVPAVPDPTDEQEEKEEISMDTFGKTCSECALHTGIDKKTYHCGGIDCYKNEYGFPVPTAQACRDHFVPRGQEVPAEQHTAEISVTDSGNTGVVKQWPVFNYSELDNYTRDSLKVIEKSIAEIKARTVYWIGTELKKAHDVMAKNGYGTFGAWVETIGFSRDSAENYIRAADFIAENFSNPEQAIGIQPSLLFAASKPSAPPQLSQAVVAGDITQHKEYVEALRKLKEVEKDAEVWRSASREAEQQAIARTKERDFEAKKAENNLRELQKLKQQLEQIRRNADPAKVKELGKVIEAKQAEIADLKEQLKDKPVDVPGMEIREVVPEGLETSWCYNLQMAIYQVAELSDADITRIIRRLGVDNYAVLKGDFRMNAIKAVDRLRQLTDTIIKAPVPATAFLEWAKGV